MRTFAFMIHAMDTSDVARKYPVARYLPDRVVEAVLRRMPPVVASEITGVRSPHAEIRGWFVGCTLTARQMLSLPEPVVLDKIIRTGRLAQRLGAQLLGLGAFTKVVGDAGVSVARALDIPVTTGNSYTVATAIEGAREAARLMGHDFSTANVAVVGASGAIGSACAHLLARDVRYLTLVGRSAPRLEVLAQKLMAEYGLAAAIATDLSGTLRRADVVIAVSSALEAIIQPDDLKPGAVVCDVARPRDVSEAVRAARDDVLVIDGGVVEVPGDVDFGLDFGFPPRTTMACMAETMILALEGRLESFTLGRSLTVQQVDEISRLAKKHGFRLAGFRSFERPLEEEAIAAIRRRAQARRGMVVAAAGR